MNTNGFALCENELPEFGTLVTLLLKDGTTVQGWRTESCFDEELGYVYEDTTTLDHRQKDVVGWKF